MASPLLGLVLAREIERQFRRIDPPLMRFTPIRLQGLRRLPAQRRAHSSDRNVGEQSGHARMGDVAAVTPTGQVGTFQTRLKRLEDLGLVTRRPMRPACWPRPELDGDVPAATHTRAPAFQPAAAVPQPRLPWSVYLPVHKSL